MAVLPLSVKEYVHRISDYHQAADLPEPVEKNGAPRGFPIAEKPNDLWKIASEIFQSIAAAGTALFQYIALGTNGDRDALAAAKAEMASLQTDVDGLRTIHPELHAELSKVVDGHIQHLEQKAENSKTVIVLTGSGLACLVAAAAACIFVVQWLLTAALVAGFGIAAYSAYRYFQNPNQPPEVKPLIEGFQNRWQ